MIKTFVKILELLGDRLEVCECSCIRILPSPHQLKKNKNKKTKKKQRCQCWTPSDKTFWIRACGRDGVHIQCT